MKKSAIAAVILLLHLFVFSCQTDQVHSLATPYENDFSYMKFVRYATDLPLEEEYDYIVVGGGTAGCPLATTLSEKYSVLVLERGSVPSAYPSVLREEKFASNVMQEDDGKIPAQRFTSEDGVRNARGRILGGSSMINAGFYSRAEKEFYLTSGIEWDMDMVYKAYTWVENTTVFRPVNVETWQSVVKEALLEAGVTPDNGFNLEHIPGAKVGGSIFDSNGRRHGAVELLNRAEPNNLQVAVHATVERIIFSSNVSSCSATGIIYSDSDGRSHRAFVRGKGEVILSAGTIGSPQLLLLSGVGPQSYLSSLKIPVIYPQPNVGQFMFDNPRNSINILPPFLLQPSFLQIAGIATDFYIEALSYIVPNNSSNVTLANIASKVPGPLSYGSLRLQSSSDVRVGPNVSFNYFAHPADLARCVKGLRKIADLLKTNSLKPFRSQNSSGTEGFNFYGPSLPTNQADDAPFETFCRTTVATFWHYHGGCLVGKVVDSSLRVIGINSLRVVDGSTFNFSPGTNPQATVMMLGRYVGLKMLQEREVN
ncbi:(R)-mandelonitrile lyase 1 isoform X2 [Rosa chinensis]|nr:(R)-mandelonitrile lyase 1 isoform X2 [Rosa chinensis]